MTEVLSIEEGETLIHLGRAALTRYLETRHVTRPPAQLSKRLLNKAGTFVTLNRNGSPRELRGCIGFPYPLKPLAQAVIEAAICSGTEDPRFPPVTTQELHSIVVEVTVLTTPVTLEIKDRLSLPQMITVGRHGLIIEGGRSSGLLLPQVATEWDWDPSEFLTTCCIKAGLTPDSWLLEDVKVKTFEVQIFEETKPRGAVKQKIVGGK